MQLFLQLNLSELPENRSEGLIQLFYCTNHENDCENLNEGYMPFSENSVCRKISAAGPSAECEPEIDEVYPEMEIVGWEAKDDYPHFMEFHELGIELELLDEVWQMLQSSGMTPLPYDKLFGWPLWAQESEYYPIDRNSGTRMKMLFQIASEQNLPYMFGDTGVGHLTQSSDNENELAFSWAGC
jgi:uncharacterized protein YwqG